MDVATTPVLDLVNVLHQEIAQLQQLTAAAHEERQVLRRMATPAFDSINQQRQHTLGLLQVLEARRESILTDLAREWGLPVGSVTLSTVIQRVGRDMSESLTGQQREMDRLVDAVRQLMAVNRLAMTKLVDFIQHTMTAARPSSDPEPTYSESGTKRLGPVSGRVLAQRG